MFSDTSTSDVGVGQHVSVGKGGNGQSPSSAARRTPGGGSASASEKAGEGGGQRGSGLMCRPDGVWRADPAAGDGLSGEGLIVGRHMSCVGCRRAGGGSQRSSLSLDGYAGMGGSVGAERSVGPSDDNGTGTRLTSPETAGGPQVDEDAYGSSQSGAEPKGLQDANASELYALGRANDSIGGRRTGRGRQPSPR